MQGRLPLKCDAIRVYATVQQEHDLTAAEQKKKKKAEEQHKNTSKKSN
jgi:hypothetical protein